MKNLLQICDEVGYIRFDKWRRHAEMLLKESPYYYHESKSKHAFIYSSIYHQYVVFKASKEVVSR